MDIKFAGMYTIKDSFSVPVEPGNRIGFNILEGSGMVKHYVTAKVLGNPDPGSLQYIEGSYSTTTGEITVHDMVPLRDFVVNLLKVIEKGPEALETDAKDEFLSLIAEYLEFYSKSVVYILGGHTDEELSKIGPLTRASVYLNYLNFQMVLNIILTKGHGPSVSDVDWFDVYMKVYSLEMLCAVRAIGWIFRADPVDPFSIVHKKESRPTITDVWAGDVPGSGLGN